MRPYAGPQALARISSASRTEVEAQPAADGSNTLDDGIGRKGKRACRIGDATHPGEVLALLNILELAQELPEGQFHCLVRHLAAGLGSICAKD
jgi:hypothetical protein